MKSSFLLSWVTFGYFFAALFYLISMVLKKEGIGSLASWLLRVVFLTQTVAIILRWVESYQMGFGHAPLSNLYESLIFFAWTIALIYIWVEWKTKSKTIGVFAIPFAFLSMAYASFSPNINDRIQPLLPALQSNWLIAHVMTCFLGYAALAVSCSLSFMYLIRKSKTDLKKDKQGLWAYFPGISMLDELIYKTIVIGFLLLTLGIATGSVWAHSAWGTYWSWDPRKPGP
jgi:cytochrome c-type biogenesis protein CcsB